MAKKLTQDDLRYINNLKAYAIQNPDWFWSDADDASNARQYLYGIGGGGIVDEIYQETPDNIKKKISNKKLSKDASFNKFHEEWKDKQEDASKVVAGTLAASAAAPFAIGGLTSAASTGALGNAGKHVLGKIDDAVAWLSKPGTKVYDPRHIVQTILNPTKAYTGAGQAAASTLDVLGAGTGLKHADETVTRWRNGDFHLSDVPQVGLDLMGTIPAVNYFKQMGVSIPRGLSAMYNNTVKSFQDLKNGVEPVYGIRADIPELIPYSSLRDIRTSTRVSTPRSETSRLGRYDIQNLLDRGFTREQIAQLQDVVTGGNVRSNERANILAQRLRDAGINPSQPSRRDILENAFNSGDQIVTDPHGRPMTVSEARTAGVSYRPTTLDWVNTYYGYRPVQHPIYNDGSANPLFSALNNAIGVFSKDDLSTVLPEIKTVLETGYDSQKSIDDIKFDLKTLFERHNKPFLPEKLETIYAKGSQTSVDATPVFNDFKKLLKNQDGFVSNPDIAHQPYTAETVSYVAGPKSGGYSYNHNMMFKTPRQAIADWEKEVAARSLHGSVASEASKSLQSSSIAHHKYAARAKNGEGVVVYLTDADGKPIYDWTNGLEQSFAKPELEFNDYGEPVVRQVPTASLLKGNLRHWANMLQQTDDRALQPFGGKFPSLTVSMGDTDYPITFTRHPETGIVSPSYDLQMMTKAAELDDAHSLTRQRLIQDNLPRLQQYDGYVLPDGSTVRIVNDIPILETSSGNRLLSGDQDMYFSDWYDDLDDDSRTIVDDIGDITWNMYKNLGNRAIINQPRAGFRSFKFGGSMPKYLKFFNYNL